MPTTAADVVDAFLAAIVRKDLDAACALAADDLEYDNVPMGKVFGPDGLRQALEPFLGTMLHVEWTVHHQVADGDVVMNERTDAFRLADGRELAIAVAGLFVVRDGKVALWRDYFDLGSYRSQLAG